MSKKNLAFALIFSLFNFLLWANSSIAQIYRDSTATVDERVADLLSRMTLEEKIGQMIQAERTAVDSRKEDIKNYFIGSILSGGGSVPSTGEPRAWANMYDDFQSYALSTRLGIPIIYGVDAVHGHNNVKGAVIFPHNIGLGCTWNPELVRQAERITAIEVAATGLDWTFAPCIAVPQNERWGRTYEGFGETAEITQLMASAAVLGFQTDSLGGRSTSILACAKHFIGDGGTTNGKDQGNTEIDEATLRAIHLPGYIAAINAGVGSIMASYNSWNGEKCHGNYYLLTTLLKEELGFTGFVVSDWQGIDQLPGDYESDIEQAINAGIDMVMVPYNYQDFFSKLKSLVEQGRVTEQRIDDAVSRILRIKFKLGLFESPYADRSLLSTIGSAEHRQVARECVRQSLVLLKKKDGILAIPKNVRKIVLTGKNANDLGNQCGGWTISWQGMSGNITEGTTILEAVKKAIPDAEVVYSEYGEDAQGADVGIAVIGETPYAEGYGDREDLSLSQSDILAVRSLKSAGIPTIPIIISGRPLIINAIIHFCDALIAAWLPGTEGDGVADVLFGDFQPVGKLTHSWPKSMSQIPINYGDERYAPLFEYKYGITSLDDSPAGSPPEVYSSATTFDGSAIELTFNKKMREPVGEAGNFQVRERHNGIPINVTDASLKTGDSTTIVLTLEMKAKKGDTLTVNYTAGNVQSADSGFLQTFQNQEVYNTLDEPVLMHQIPGKIEAEDYFSMKGVQTEATSDIGGGLNVGWIDNTDWLDYYVNVQESGSYDVDIRIASQSQAGQFLLMKDNQVLATINVPVTGGWQNWQTVTTEVELEKGSYLLRLYVVKGGFNINWLEFILYTDVDSDKETYMDYRLEQNYPNPFNPTTEISFYLPHSEKVELTVFNLLGEKIRTLLHSEESAGWHSIRWDGNDESGRTAASGIYFYQLVTPKFRQVRKMALVQ